MGYRLLLKRIETHLQTPLGVNFAQRSAKLLAEVRHMLYSNERGITHAVMIFTRNKKREYNVYLEFEGDRPLLSPQLYTAEMAIKTFKQQRREILKNEEVRQRFLQWSENEPIYAVLAQVGHPEGQTPTMLVKPSEVKKWAIK